MVRKIETNPANRLLGENLEKARRMADLTPMQLAKKIKETEKQIQKYEAGALIPLPKIEALGTAFGYRIPKKLIRKISFFRKKEKEESMVCEELMDLYDQVFITEE